MEFEKEGYSNELEDRILNDFENFKKEGDLGILFDMDEVLEELVTQEKQRAFMPKLSNVILEEVTQEDCEENSRYGLCNMLRKLEVPFEEKEILFESFESRELSDLDKEFLIKIADEDLELLDKYFPEIMVAMPSSEMHEDNFDDEQDEDEVAFM